MLVLRLSRPDIGDVISSPAKDRIDDDDAADDPREPRCCCCCRGGGRGRLADGFLDSAPTDAATGATAAGGTLYATIL